MAGRDDYEQLNALVVVARHSNLAQAGYSYQESKHTTYNNNVPEIGQGSGTDSATSLQVPT